MADFKEDDQKTFHQEVTEGETGNFPVLSRLKKYGFLYVPFMVQLLLFIFIWCTQGEWYVPLFFGDLLRNHWFLITVVFFVVMLIFTIKDMKKEKKLVSNWIYQILSYNLIFFNDCYFNCYISLF